MPGIPPKSHAKRVAPGMKAGVEAQYPSALDVLPTQCLIQIRDQVVRMLQPD